MPEPTDEELGLDSQEMEGLDPNIRAELRRSRQLTKDNEALRAEAENARREAAFAKAGIPDSPLGQMFGKAYDGPTDDPTAIKASFEALGVPTTSPPAGSATDQQSGGVSDDELAAQRQVSTLGAGGEAGGDVLFEDALKSAGSQKDVLALIQSAPQGSSIGLPEIN
jgi:hypothetical protein